MVPIAADELAAVCGDADPDTVAGFVADLYEARGRTVEREQATSFVLVTPGGRERVVVPGGDARPADADAVVVAGRASAGTGTGDGPRHVEAVDLRDALLYAIGRERADDLLRRWFDRSLDSFDGADERARQPASPAAGPPSATAPATPPEPATAPDHAPNGDQGGDRGSDQGGDRTAGMGRGARPPPTGGGDGNVAATDPDHGRRTLATWGGLAVGLLVAAAMVGWVAGVPVGTGPGQSPGAEAGAPDPQTPLTAVGTDTATPATGGGTADPPDEQTPSQSVSVPSEASFPPGIDEDGIADYSRLVGTNRVRLANRSFRVSVVYREFVGGAGRGVFAQTVAVENDTTYAVSTTRVGRLSGSPPALADGDVFVNGTGRFERTAEGVRRRPVTDASGVMLNLSRYLRWYLSVEDSRIAGWEHEGATTVYRLATEGDPWPGVRNASGYALVTESGLVEGVYRTHDDPDTGVRVAVAIRVTDVGETTVSRPSWLSASTATPASASASASTTEE